MTSYLVATSSVHVTAAAADYLDGRLDSADDHLVVVGVREREDPERDAGDAMNVARSRLAAVAPEIDQRDGDASRELRAAIDEHDPDVVVIGSSGGTPDASGLGSTASELLADLDRPVVVVTPTI